MSKTIRYDWRKRENNPQRARKLVAKQVKRTRSIIRTILMLNPFGGLL